VTSEADGPRSSSSDDEKRQSSPENLSEASEETKRAPSADEAELAADLELPLNALLDWGADPSSAEGGLETPSPQAIVAAERDEYLDALRRLQADFDNFRKRSIRQQTDLLEHATEGLCVRLLPVLDALDLATAHIRSQAEPDDSGKALEQIDSLIRDILAREGIERIDAVGVAFDPTIHDAVGQLPPEPHTHPVGAHAPSRGDAAKAAKPAKAAGSSGSGEPTHKGGVHGSADPDKATKAAAQSGPTVGLVMRPGYRMKSKVLRPAMVLVGG